MHASRIDHVHIEVTDRKLAAAWYRDVLGLEPSQELQSWADDPTGPLILQTADGHPALSLFARPQKPLSRDNTVAFRLDGTSFLAFLAGLNRMDLVDRTGKKVTATDLSDHHLSWSIYFVDPDGNRLEVTTYDYAHVAAHMTNE